MRRQKRKRSTRRRGLQHIGDVLSNILTDIDQGEAEQTQVAAPADGHGVPVAAGMPSSAASSQNTFSFYQPAEV